MAIRRPSHPLRVPRQSRAPPCGPRTLADGPVPCNVKPVKKPEKVSITTQQKVASWHNERARGNPQASGLASRDGFERNPKATTRRMRADAEVWLRHAENEIWLD